MKTIDKHSSVYLYTRLFSYVRPFWVILLLGISANILYSLVDAGLTYMVKIFFDKGFIDVDIPYVKKIPIILFLAISLRGIAGALGNYLMTWVARAVIKVLRQQIFAHIIKLPADYYDQTTTGALLSKILYDVEQVAQVSADALTDTIQNFFLLIGMLGVMFYLNWQLSLVFLTTVPLIGVIVNLTSKRVRRLSHRGQKAMGVLTAVAGESIEGYRVIRIFDGEQYELSKFNQAVELSRINDMKVALNKVINVVGVQVVTAIGIASIFFSAIYLAQYVTVSPSDFLAIMVAMFQLIRPLKIFANLNSVFQRGLAGAESVFSLLDEPIEAQGGKVLPDIIRGEIDFEQVSFAYRQGSTVLDEVSFVVPAGKTIALVGQSGGGKTTIGSLLPRFYELTKGKITIDDIDISTLSLSSLRSKISHVSQHVCLFNDTIANNIAYGLFEVKREKIIEAAKQAYAHEFISRLPDGYETLVGENGVLLSGGQRQRLAIARAILKNAPILILDEATSALDSESEGYIQKALDIVRKNRTTIVIAHRLSTIKSADKIIVLHQGKLVEEGTHASLLAQEGYYYKLYYGQSPNHFVSNIEAVN